jgi:hypothetical protein
VTLSRVVVTLVFSLALAGCDPSKLLPQPQDGGIVTVPGSYHSARMTPGHKAHLLLTGDKKVECHDCHAIADAGFESPGTALCANCHEKQMGQHHPVQDAGTVTDGGTQVTCLTCHVFHAESPDVRFDKWACITCHAKPQGDKPAITVHVENCASCHRPHELPFTQAADCTTCHAVTLKHGAKGDTVADTCMGCHPHHSKAVVASGQCLTCHQKDTMEARARVSPGALFEKGHVGCGTCHTAHIFQKTEVKACTSCHTGQHVLAPSAHKLCITCHQPHADKSKPKACESCHKKELAALKHPPQKETVAKCTGCHPPHPESAEANIAVACITCHKTAPFTNDVVHAATTSCDACHVPHAGKPKAEVLCVSCHEKQVTAVKKNAGHAKCADCHVGFLPHGERVEPKPCLSCHAKMKPPQQGHKECASCHESHSATVVKQCATCHLSPTSAPLPGLHAVQKHRDCKSCHAPHEPQPGFGPASCMKCHPHLPQKDHPTPPAQCVGCHLFKPAN